MRAVTRCCSVAWSPRGRAASVPPVRTQLTVLLYLVFQYSWSTPWKGLSFFTSEFVCFKDYLLNRVLLCTKLVIHISLGPSPIAAAAKYWKVSDIYSPSVQFWRADVQDQVVGQALEEALSFASCSVCGSWHSLLWWHLWLCLSSTFCRGRQYFQGSGISTDISLGFHLTDWDYVRSAYWKMWYSKVLKCE